VPYALLLPGLLVIAVLLLYPLYQMADMSFHKVGLRQIRPNPQPAENVGLDNYRQVLDSDLFWSSLRNTVVFALITVALTLVVGTLVGLLLHRLGKKMSMLVIVGIMAASTLMTIPVIAFFLLVQRRMVSGLVAGAVKG
jgi:N,N'-diacetylchitobiose transport system permease protein